MTVDMRQFFQVFFEEAEEHLANMEGLLLELDLAEPDPEEVNAIFRAAHSIKGGSATFGFQDMADATHVLETMLDRVRKGELSMTSEMVDAALAAGDTLSTMLGAHKGGAPADASQVTAVCERLRQLTADEAPQLATQVAVVVSPQERAEQVEVRFEAAPHAAGDPEVIRGLVDELRQIGNVEVVQLPDQGGTVSCHLRVVGTSKDDDIAGILDFVAQPGSLRIERSGDEGKAAAAETEMPIEDDSFGFFEPVAPATPVALESADGSFGLFLPAESAPVQGSAIAPAPAVESVARLPSATANAHRGSGDGGSIRVGVDKVDQLINLVGELVITQAMLAQSADRLDPALNERLFSGLSQLERNTRDLQESVMSIRMLPISGVFNRFPRVVRDLSQKLGKQVDLITSGESTELDKGLIERITDPLTHLVRNSIDHGIEMPDARIAMGKTAAGMIRLSASQQSGNIVIEVADDGAGLRRDRILDKAKERGLPVSDAMSDQDVWALIMEPGFSTAEQVTEVSGRGVGMDVVRKNVSALGGRIEIDSVAGAGTRMTVRLPLTLAILDGMSVAVGAETYIIPLDHVIESLQPTRAMLKAISGTERLIQVRDEYLPVTALHEVFGVKPRTTDFTQGIMVILESDGARGALFVDDLVGQQQVVIKSLEANYRRVPGVSAATIMGDGRVALILDVAALLSRSQSRPRLAA